MTSPSGCPDIWNKKVRKSRCIEGKSGVESGPELRSHSKPLHPKIAIILDLSEHVDVDDDPEEAEQRGMINCNLQRWRSRQKNYHEQHKQHEKYQSSKSRSPEYHPHATYNQPIELEAPVAGGERGQSEL